MNPLVSWCIGRHERPHDDSWHSARPIMATLTFLILFLSAVWWLFGSELDRYLPQTFPNHENHMELSEYYMLVSAISAVLFIVVTIFHAFFNIPFLATPQRSPTTRSESRVSEKENEILGLDIMNNTESVDELCNHGEASLAATLDTYTKFYDVITAENDKSRTRTLIDKRANKYEDTEQTVKPCNLLDPEQNEIKRLLDENNGLRDQNVVPVSGLSHNLELEDQEKVLQNSNKCVASQCDAIPKPVCACAGTMTTQPEVADASVGSHQQFKVVRSCDTSTSGPFMKKLRRAQRLLKEARLKMKTDRQERLIDWTVVLARYKEKVQTLLQSLEKKDILLSYTALNRALSENEVKDMCTSVSSARDRLLTQCKLNFALKEVVESKCDSGTTDLQSPNQTTQN